MEYKSEFQQKLAELKMESEKRRLDNLRKKYAVAPDFSNMSLYDEIGVRYDLDELSQLEKKFGTEQGFQPSARLQLALKNSNDSYRNQINKYLPYSFVQSYDVLRNAKEEMEAINTRGSDNYYHSVGMCENAQAGRPFSTLALGVLKEGWDAYHKCKNGMPVKDIVSDGIKDMENNIRGIYYGMKYPYQNCRDIFHNLDWKTNKMY